MTQNMVLIFFASMVSIQPLPAHSLQPITFPGVAEIEFGEWPLEKADPGAVEAVFRHEIVRLQESK